jgi:hypothetical protein
MPETPQQYTERLLSYVAGRDARQVLSTTPARLRELTRGRSREVLTRAPSPGRWSVAQILAHLADAEIVGAWRFRSVLATSTVPLQAYDQERWAEAFRYEQAPVEESLDTFDATRRSTLSLLGRVDPALFEHYGVHAERGHESVHHLVRLYAGHDINHLRQVEALLGEG